MKLKTVTIDRGGVPVRINASDLREYHTLWGQDKPQNKQKPKQPEPPDEDDEKDALISELAELGINKDRRSSVDKLRELLEEALQ